ncbi:MAG: Lon protease-like protein [Paraglaciecola sp.]|jgi:Lon protease-like protein
MSLRIFEPRYIRMVKEACATAGGFGVCMLNSQRDKQDNQDMYPIGTYVKVVDFDILKDGFLGITVQGERCFRIIDMETEADGLRLGRCEWLEVWKTEKEITENINPIDERLREVFAKYPDISTLYNEPKFNDPIWVIYRWLELIPVEAELKQEFLQQKDCIKALTFLTQLVE